MGVPEGIEDCFNLSSWNSARIKYKQRSHPKHLRFEPTCHIIPHLEPGLKWWMSATRRGGQTVGVDSGNSGPGVPIFGHWPRNTRPGEVPISCPRLEKIRPGKVPVVRRGVQNVRPRKVPKFRHGSELLESALLMDFLVGGPEAWFRHYLLSLNTIGRTVLDWSETTLSLSRRMWSAPWKQKCSVV